MAAHTPLAAAPGVAEGETDRKEGTLQRFEGLEVYALTGRISVLKRFGKKLAIAATHVLDSDDPSLRPGSQIDIFLGGEASRAEAVFRSSSAAWSRGVATPPQVFQCEYTWGCNRQGEPILHCHRLLALRWDPSSFAAVSARELAARQAASASPKSMRFIVFADWLIATFGLPLLSSGTGVLDVAGGAGGLSVALLERGVRRVTLVEPDPCGDRHARVERSERAGCIDPQLGNIASTASRIEELRQKLGEGFSHIATPFTSALVDSEEYAALLSDCSVVVGMHPDQATQMIVEWSAAQRKPFAVVPCCVFPGIFGWRRQFWHTEEEHRNGTVRSYPTFLRYLEKLAEANSVRSETAVLPVAGRNIVLYSTGNEVNCPILLTPDATGSSLCGICDAPQ